MLFQLSYPLAVAALFGIKIEGVDLSFLPPIYAAINGLTAVGLILALVAVKSKNFSLHEKLIKVCMGLSLVFLLMYVAYHITSETTIFEELNDSVRILYYPYFSYITLYCCHPICSVFIHVWHYKSTRTT